MKRSFSAMSPRRGLIIVLSLLAWTAALIVLFVIFGREKPEADKPVFGSLEGRFRSDTSMVHDEKTLYYRESEITNFLLIGVDREDLSKSAGYQSGGQADYLVVLAVDRANRRVTPVMIDRDTIAEVQTFGVFGHPAGKKNMQICLAQAYSGTKVSGFDNTVSSVETLLSGIKIDRCLALDMQAIPILNDVIGGVEITLFDDFTSFDPSMRRGVTMRLRGDQAKFFVRGRMTVSDGSNASRMLRQQTYMKAFLDQVKLRMAEDDNFAAEALAALSGHMYSDADESVLFNEISLAVDYQWMPVRTPLGEHRMGDDGFAEFHADVKELKRLTAEIWFES